MSQGYKLLDGENWSHETRVKDGVSEQGATGRVMYATITHSILSSRRIHEAARGPCEWLNHQPKLAVLIKFTRAINPEGMWVQIFTENKPCHFSTNERS